MILGCYICYLEVGNPEDFEMCHPEINSIIDLEGDCSSIDTVGKKSGFFLVSFDALALKFFHKCAVSIWRDSSRRALLNRLATLLQLSLKVAVQKAAQHSTDLEQSRNLSIFFSEKSLKDLMQLSECKATQ